MIIFSNGKTCADIVLPTCASPCERFAADELKKYLDLITNEEFSVITTKSLKKDFNIYVGATQKALSLFENEYLSLGQDSFVVRNVGNDLFLFGRESVYSQSATIYAVYEFLEKYLGVRFYAVDEEMVPKKEHIEIDDIDILSNPSFINRQPLYGTQRKNAQFALKLRIKDKYVADLLGGSLDLEWGTAQGHNFYDLIPPAVYEKEHPEWFDKENGELCFSQESLTDELFEVLKREIISHPNAKYFALSQNDTVKSCQCDKCKASYEKYGVTGTMMRFVNRVAKMIEEWSKESCHNREIYIVTFAYYFSIKPPVVKNKKGEYIAIDESCIPNKNVYIFFTTIDFCFYHELADTTCEWNKDFLDTFYGWKSLVGERIHVWNYCTNYVHYLYPFFNFESWQKNYKFFKDNGVRYLLDHGNCETEFADMAEMRAYLASKLMWDVNLNVEEEAKGFIQAYYKEAAKEVEEYLKLLRERFKKIDEIEGYHLRVYNLPQEMYAKSNFPIEFIEKLRTTFARGFDKIEKIEDEAKRALIKKRLMRVDLSARYLLLINYDEYYQTGKEEFIEKYLQDIKYCEIANFRESMSMDNMQILQERALKGVLYRYDLW